MKLGNSRSGQKKLGLIFCLLFLIMCLIQDCFSNSFFEDYVDSDVAFLKKEGKERADSIDVEKYQYFESVLICLEESDLLKLDKKIQVNKLGSHQLFKEYLSWKSLYQWKDLEVLPKGEIYSTKLTYESAGKSEEFQIWFFDDISEAKKEFNRFEKLTNSMSAFEKPFKFFFRKKNMIFYITFNNFQNGCSGRVIEYLSKILFGYDVDYSDVQYVSKRKRNKLSREL